LISLSFDVVSTIWREIPGQIFPISSKPHHRLG
jgi:hypothetical protein